MLKLKALITTLVLGAASAATAQPSVTFHGEANAQWGTPRRPVVVNPADRFDRSDRGYGFQDTWRDRRDSRNDNFRDNGFNRPRMYRPSWVALNEPMQLDRGREVIDVRMRGTFTQLRLQTTAGASYVDKVVILFRDGSRQIAQLDRQLDPRSPMVQVLLDGNNREIDRIIVVGESRRNAAIQVFGI